MTFSDFVIRGDSLECQKCGWVKEFVPSTPLDVYANASAEHCTVENGNDT